MAITTTPLGFQKPDGNEPFRQGNDVISANAQKAQDLIAADKARLALLERSAGFPGDPVELADDVVQVLVTDPSSGTALALSDSYAAKSVEVEKLDKAEAAETYTAIALPADTSSAFASLTATTATRWEGI